MPDDVQIKVKAVIDQSSLNRVSSQITQTLSRTTKDFDANLQRAEKRILSFTSVAGVIYGVQKGFTELVKSTIAVEKSLLDINVIVGTSNREMKKFGDQLFQIAKETNQTFTSVAKAATEFSRQGLTLNETLSRTRDALRLTQLAGISAEDAVDSLTATVNSFNKSMLTSTEIVNKFAAVDAKFAVSSADLAEAVKRVGSSAQEAGVDLNQLIAIVTTAQQTTARGGAVIGNALKTIFQKIERPQTLEQLSQLGVAVRNANQEMLPAIDILSNLAKSYDHLEQSQKSQIAEMVGGIYQVNVLKATLSDLEKQAGSTFLSAFKTAENAGNIAIERSEELRKSISSLLNTAGLNLQKGGTGIFEKVFGDNLRSGLKYFNGIFEREEGTFNGFGNKLGESMLVGFGNTLKTQGGVLIASYLIGIVGSLSRGIYKAVTEVTLMNTKTREQEILQSRISDILKNNPVLLANSAQAQRTILSLLDLEIQKREQIAAISGATAKIAATQGFSISPTSGNLYRETKKVNNLADPIRSAINREISSGVPASSIRIGSNPMLVSGQNPGGLGVYNTIDEPSGLSQGIARGVKEGANLKNYGIPNFAFGQFSHGEPQSFGESWYKSNLVSQEARLSGLFQSISKLTSAFENLEKTTRTTSFGAKSVFENLEKTTRSLKNYTDYKQSNYLLGYKQPVGLLGQGQVFNMPEYGYESQQRINERRASAINRIGLSATGSKGGDFVFDAGTGQMLPGKLASWQSGYDPIDITKFTHTPGSFYSAGRPINKPTPQLLLGLGSMPSISLNESQHATMNATLAPRIPETLQQAKQSKLSSWYEKAFSEKNSGKLSVLSIGLPFLTNTAANMIGTETRGARVAGAVTSGLGNIVSGTIIGGQIGGGPGGAIAGATVTSLATIYSVFKEWTSILPDLTKNLEDAKKKTSDLESGFQGFIKASDLLKDTSLNLSQRQLVQLVNQQNASLTPFNAEERLRLNTAFLRGGQTEASSVFNEIAAPYQAKKQIASIAEYLGAEGGGIIDAVKTGYAMSDGGEGRGGVGGSGRPTFKTILNKKGNKILSNVRSSVASIANTSGKNLESLLIDDDQLREYVFRQVDKGNYREALVGGLGGLGIDNFSPDDEVDRMLAAVSSDTEKQTLLKEFFSGDFSKSNLEKLKGSGRKALEVRNNLSKKRGELTDKFYRFGSASNLSSLIRQGNYQKSIEDWDFKENLNTVNIENATEGFRGGQGIDYARAEGYSSPSQLLSLESSQKMALAIREIEDKRKIAAYKTINDVAKLKASSMSEFESTLGPTLQGFLSTRSSSAEGGIYDPKAFSETTGQIGAIQGLMSNPAKLKEFIDSELEKTTKDLIENKYAPGSGRKEEYLDLLKKLADQTQELNQRQLEASDKINKDKERTIQLLNKEEEKVKAIANAEAERARILLENQRKLNTAALEEAKLTEAILAPQKLGYAASLYSENKIGTSEMESARSGAMEAYRAKYGINSSLESSNRYAAFRDQFSYTELDKMREMEKAAADLGATMKSSFADGFKAFSTGAASAGQAFKQFGMGVLDRISTIVSNISTNMLFNSIGNLLPTSGFGNLLSGAMKYSSGGLVTGGSGVKDDVPQMLAPGDFVVKKAAVNKYGTSFMATLNNSYDYNDPKYPTAGSFNIDPRLSSLALEDPNNPQNDLRNSRESNLMSYIKDKEQYDANKANAMAQYRAAQNQRLIGAYISAGIMAGATGLNGAFGGARDSFGKRIPTGGYTYPTNGVGTGTANMNLEMIGRANGGSIPGASTRADTVPTLLMGGEYVVRRDAVNRVGLPVLNQINAMRYASGGLVGSNNQVNSQENGGESFTNLITAINMLRSSLEKPSSQSLAQSNSGITNYINVSVTTNSSGDTSVETSTKSQGGKTQNNQNDIEGLKKFSDMVKATVYDVTIKECRPGGLIRNMLAA